MSVVHGPVCECELCVSHRPWPNKVELRVRTRAKLAARLAEVQASPRGPIIDVDPGYTPDTANEYDVEVSEP